MIEDQPPVVGVGRARDAEFDRHAWPATIPAVAQMLGTGLRLGPGVTFLVGENGAGKSTLVEAIAQAYGFSGEGGSHHARHSTRATESPLGNWITVQRGIGHKQFGFFLRAETMHGLYSYMEDLGPGPPFHEMSHGESFLEVFEERFLRPGFYCMDEPESALSFDSSLRLLMVLNDLAKKGGQVLCATHSPLIASLPGARILEVGEWGIRESTWAELEIVGHWRSYLDSPERYLRHLLE